MRSLLAAKLGCLLGLLLLPLLCGLLPARLRGVGAHGRWRSFVSCVAGGIFLAAGLLDMVPDSLSDMREELRSQRITVDFPVPEFVLTVGFWLVLIIEHVVLDCNERRSGEATPLLSCGEATPQPADSGEGVVEMGAHHFPADFQAHSSFRSFVLFLSLSVHSLFEGLAVGLQDTESQVLQICIAILVHKSVIAVSLSFLLLQSQVPTCWFVALIGTFALMSPLGITVGIVMMQNPGPSSTMAQCLLEGIAAGTFVYITFLEILPHELNSSKCRLPKVLAMLLGFSVMAALRFLG
ncbi:zinc transporter ZIP1-like [Carettochelys insculpta]|uniref:zinc transporter ZIP1-like n=1 Tax=Carettochelys insculpta TaxID=44489 RepID=UPI003EB92A9E